MKYYSKRHWERINVRRMDRSAEIVAKIITLVCLLLLFLLAVAFGV